jgi:hypothetical protein
MRVNLLARRPVTVRRDVPTMEVGAAVAVSVASGRRLRLCRKHGEQLIPGYGFPAARCEPFFYQMAPASTSPKSP